MIVTTHFALCIISLANPPRDMAAVKPSTWTRRIPDLKGIGIAEDFMGAGLDTWLPRNRDHTWLPQRKNDQQYLGFCAGILSMTEPCTMLVLPPYEAKLLTQRLTLDEELELDYPSIWLFKPDEARYVKACDSRSRYRDNRPRFKPERVNIGVKTLRARMPGSYFISK